MRARVDDRRTRYLTFVLLALAINLIDSRVDQSIADPSRQFFVAAAASVDVILVVSLLYYWLLVRPGVRAPASLTFIALLGALHATYFWPVSTPVRLALGALCELGVIGFVALSIRRHRTGKAPPDTVDAVQLALADAFLPPFAARLIATEIGILYYALFTWRAKPDIPSDAQSFSIHKQAGQIELLSGLAIACLMEIVPVHLLLRHWNPTGAWIATAAGLYAVIWLHGIARSIALRPVLIGPDYLDLRYGLSFRLRVDPNVIARVWRAEAEDAKSALVLPKGSQPNVCIDLASSQTAQGLFGTRKKVNRIALQADEPLAFQRALAQLIRI